MEQLPLLRGCEAHMTHIPTPGDEKGLRQLGNIAACNNRAEPLAEPISELASLGDQLKRDLLQLPSPLLRYDPNFPLVWHQSTFFCRH